ncbi:hypothetical protein TNCV_3233521 [Trichonephila clavipes]|nr:hypothetical protein TNCV_3233521 [Trichonephila clavipes]
MVRHMGRSDAAIRRCWQEWVENSRFPHHDDNGRPRATANLRDESCFQLCPDDHRRRVWKSPGTVPILLSLLHAIQALNQELWSGVPFLLTAGSLWSSLEAHLQHSCTSTTFCFGIVPFAVPWPYFSAR